MIDRSSLFRCFYIFLHNADDFFIYVFHSSSIIRSYSIAVLSLSHIVKIRKKSFKDRVIRNPLLIQIHKFCSCSIPFKFTLTEFHIRLHQGQYLLRSILSVKSCGNLIHGRIQGRHIKVHHTCPLLNCLIVYAVKYQHCINH